MHMRFLRQFAIIMAVTFVSEVLHYYIHLPVPASIYGLVIMFILLCTRIVKLPDVEDTAKFLIEIMPVMFIPAGIGLIESVDVLKPILLPVSVITLSVTVIVMAVTGRVTQLIIRKGGKGDE